VGAETRGKEQARIARLKFQAALVHRSRREWILRFDVVTMPLLSWTGRTSGVHMPAFG
jgi:hypothetical protein